MSPTVAGFVRGVALAVGAAAVDAAVTYLTGHSLSNLDPNLALAQPVIIWGLRTIEGALDSSLQKSGPSSPITGLGDGNLGKP